MSTTDEDDDCPDNIGCKRCHEARRSEELVVTFVTSGIGLFGRVLGFGRLAVQVGSAVEGGQCS